MTTDQIKYASKVKNGFKFWVGMLWRLPSVAFWGIKVKDIDESSCTVALPFSWRTQNPFRSAYFGAQLGAGELATGLLCQLHLAGRADHSMLVIDFSARFLKKATTTIRFVCDEGTQLKAALDDLKQNGDTCTLVMHARGIDTNGVEVSNITLTWSFKLRG